MGGKKKQFEKIKNVMQKNYDYFIIKKEEMDIIEERGNRKELKDWILKKEEERKKEMWNEGGSARQSSLGPDI